MNTTLYVGNLADSVTEKTLQDLFAPHGVVEKAILILDHTTGKPRGFGFVTLSTPEAATAALQAMNGAEVEGKKLVVNEARQREDRPGRSFGGGGGGGGPRGGGGYRGGGDRRGGSGGDRGGRRTGQRS